MSVVIRLTRAGARHRPFYRIVVTDSRMPRDGRFIATLGTYDPLAEKENVKVNSKLVNEWISKGARPSVAVKHLLKRADLAREPEVVSKKAARRVAEAVSLDELRSQAAEGGEHVEEQVPMEEEEVKTVAPKKRASSKSTKPVRKGASRKKKAD